MPLQQLDFTIRKVLRHGSQSDVARMWYGLTLLAGIILGAGGVWLAVVTTTTYH